jgi:hypothetical protein
LKSFHANAEAKAQPESESDIAAKNAKMYLENEEKDGDDDEKQKCIRYFRYNYCELLHILAKKEGYFANLTAKKVIKTYNSIIL